MATLTPPEEIQAVPGDQSQPVTQEENREVDSSASEGREVPGPQPLKYDYPIQHVPPRTREQGPSTTSRNSSTRSRSPHHTEGRYSEHAYYEGDGTSRQEPEVRRNRAYGATENDNLLQEERRNHSEPSVGDYEPVNLENDIKLFTINMKRYIFSTLGIPGIPGMQSRGFQRLCTCTGLVFYIMLFMWGVVLFVVPITLSREEKDGTRLRVLTVLAGSFFIFLGLYWILVYWWSKVSRGNSRVISFSGITALWFCLCMYFIGVASALATEIYVDYCRAYGDFFNYSNCTGSTDNAEVPYSLFAISSMALLWFIFVFSFIVNMSISCTRGYRQ